MAENIELTKLKFDANGVIPSIIQNLDGLVLYLCSINQEALFKIQETGNMWRYSVSQKRLLEVGSESGKREYVKEIRTNCYADTLLVRVQQEKNFACHKGYATCFYRKLDNGLFVVADEQIVDPKQVYKK